MTGHPSAGGTTRLASGPDEDAPLAAGEPAGGDEADARPHEGNGVGPGPARRSGDAGRVLSGRYELRRRVGSGGMASVWEATDQVLARSVAVKLLHEHLADDEAFRERFRREAIAAARLAHANIVGLYDTGTDAEQEFLVMEYVEGVTLRDLIAGTDGLPSGPAATIACKIGQGLAYAHSRGLVHRDVKPANILIGDDGGMKITDFGIAKADHGDDLTSTGMVLGTAAYVAPEQILAEAIDGQADQYALACVLYESLTGKQPFRGDTAVATAAARLERETPSVRSIQPEIPIGLDAIVARGMARDPRERFPSVGDFSDALLSFVDADTDRTAALALPVAELVASARSGRDAPTPVPTPPPRDDGSGGEGATAVRDAHDATVATPLHDGLPAAPPVEETTPVPAAPPREPAPPEDEARPHRGRRAAGALLAVLLVAVTSGAIALGLVQSGLLERPGRAASTVEPPTASAEPSASPTPAAAATVQVALRPGALSVIDPAEDGRENDEQLPNLLDGDEETSWETEGYNSEAAFRSLKAGRGLGIVIDLGTVREVTAVELDVAHPGFDLELLGGTQRPEAFDDETLDQLEELGARDDVPARTVFDFEQAARVRYLVVRIVGGLQPDGGDFVRGGFSEVRVEASATG